MVGGLSVKQSSESHEGDLSQSSEPNHDILPHVDIALLKETCVIAAIAHFVDEKLNWQRRHLQLVCVVCMAATAARISPTTLSSFYEIGILPHRSDTSLRTTKMPTVDNIFETLEPEIYQAIKTKKGM
jgi:hypothetical protein